MMNLFLFVNLFEEGHIVFITSHRSDVPTAPCRILTYQYTNFCHSHFDFLFLFYAQIKNAAGWTRTQ